MQRAGYNNVGLRFVSILILALLVTGSQLLLAFPREASAAGAPTYNVKNYGAVGNGTQDDTNAIQAAINAVDPAAGGTVSVPSGVYIVRYNAQGGHASLKLKSNMTFEMDPAAEIKLTANSSVYYQILDLTSVQDVTITGGTITGDRATHTGATGEWGYGISVWNGKDITIDGVTARDCWGDGFFVNGTDSTTTQNVTIQNCAADNNRRQGLTICDLNGGTVTGNTFINTNGTLPMGGIDLEPYDAAQTVSNITISGNTFRNNYAGVVAGGAAGSVSNVTISGNVIESNRSFGFWIDSSRSFAMSFNIVRNNGGPGIELLGCTGFNVNGNQVYGNQGSGIRLAAGFNTSTVSTNSTIQYNTATGNAWNGIELTGGSTYNSVSGNNIWGNGGQPIYTDGTPNNTIAGNSFDPNNPVSPPSQGAAQISSIAPTSGAVGASVTVTGTGFGSPQGSSYVSFGSVKATEYTAWSDTEVQCKVPSGASGKVGVTVATPGGTSAPKVFKVVPRISRISPTSGKKGTRVTVTGTGFGNSWGRGKGDSGNESSSVTFNGAQTSNCPQWSDTEITAVVPQGATTGPVVIVVDGTESNADNTLMVTRGSSFFFAEGYTGENFAEYLCIGNPNNTVATANVTYMFSDGTTKDASYNVSANSRYTVDVNSEVGAGKEVSIRVLSETANLVAERPMYFNYNGVWTGGSEAAGAPSLAKNWYFAEGNTLDGFDQYVTVLNPGGAVANLTLHYMVEGQGEVPVGALVNPNTRATFKTRDQIGPGKNASLYLESDQDVVAERSMYFNYQGLAANSWTGGHVVLGAYSPARDWYFAEGTTRSGFEQWLCLQNPGSEPITVDATYQLGPNQGDPVQKSYTVPARQRLTVPVNVELGTEKDDSVYLSSTSDFIAERPMYFDYQGIWDGGHDVLGANDSANTWFFADGYTGDNFNEWLCLQNPGTDTANVTITYYPTSGAPLTKPWTVPPNSRLTINVNDDAGSNLEISTKVSSDKPIIAERPMYFAYQGAWTGGHDVMGFVPSP